MCEGIELGVLNYAEVRGESCGGEWVSNAGYDSDLYDGHLRFRPSDRPCQISRMKLRTTSKRRIARKWSKVSRD
jgi:hypothetical protein